MRMPFFGEEIYALREAVVSASESEEDAQVLIRLVTQELEQTNWSQLITKKKAEYALREERRLNREVPCKRCKKKFKFRDLKRIEVAWGFGFYCAQCFDHFNNEHSYTCPFCNVVYLSEKFSQSCPACRIKDEAKEALVLQRHLREAKKAGRTATLRLHDWFATLQHFGGYCAYCQKQPYQVLEHFIPINPGQENGGGTTVDNCVPACERCNKKKQNVFPDAMLRQAVIVHITSFPQNSYGIDIKAIERVWRYLDTKRQPVIAGWTFEERKRYHSTEVTEWWAVKKPELRQRVIDILHANI